MEESVSENLLAPISIFVQRCFVLSAPAASAFPVLSAYSPSGSVTTRVCCCFVKMLKRRGEAGEELAPPHLSLVGGKQPQWARREGATFKGRKGR